MKTDELRAALEDLAGATPEVDGALGRVTRRARRDRVRNRGAVLAVVCVIAATAFGVSRRSSPEHIVVRNPPTPPAGNVADLSWTRVAGPPFTIQRIVTAYRHTYALANNAPRGGGSSIYEISADGHARELLHRSDSSGTTAFNDLIGFHGALVAVGSISGPSTDPGGDAAAWRSTDGGATWRSVPVEQSPAPPLRKPSATNTGRFPAFTPAGSRISRIIASGGQLYALGFNARATPNGGCRQGGWTSTDGRRFALAPANNPIPCGAADATDGPHGVVGLDQLGAATIVGRTKIPIARDASVAQLASDGHGYVAVGNAGASGAIWWSPDGRTWTRVVTATVPGRIPPSVSFTGVAHSAAGWVAVGTQALSVTEKGWTAVRLWTSSDGKRWIENKRDDGTFELFGGANGLGVTSAGMAIFGTNITGQDINGTVTRTENVLWMGSSTPSAKPVGIIEGTLEEIGGRRPLLRPVAGTVTITSAGGHSVEVQVGADGWYSTLAKPGTYSMVGHSPQYQDGKYECGSRLGLSDMNGDPVIVRPSVVSHVDLLCPVR